MALGIVKYVYDHPFQPIGVIWFAVSCREPGPQREKFPGDLKVDIGPPNLIGPPKPYRGPCH